MTLRLTAAALLALAPLAGCTWESRPDGGSPMHTDGNDRSYMTDRDDETDLVEPIDPATAAPVGDPEAVQPSTPVDPGLPTTPQEPGQTPPIIPETPPVSR